MLLVDKVKEEQEKKIPRSKKQDSVQIKKIAGHVTETTSLAFVLLQQETGRQ